MKTLVLDIAGLNPAFLGCYGNDWIATPTIDALAAAGVVFDHHYVQTPRLLEADPAPWSAIVNLLRSSDHVHVLGPSLAAPWTLPDDLFTAYTEDDELEPWTGPGAGELSSDDDILRVQDTYAAAVTMLDAQLGKLLEAFDEEPWADELTLVLTASCGYPLGEHGRLGWDRPWLHEELVHVPLIVLPPNDRFAGCRVRGITQPADIEGDFDLGKLVEGEGRPFAVSTWQLGDRAELSLRTKEWALILPTATATDDPPRGRQLFAKPDDRWEVNDLAAKNPDLADELERTLRDSVG